MSRRDNKNKKNKQKGLVIFKFVKTLLKIIFVIVFFFFLFTAFISAHNPAEKKYIKNSRYAYNLIEKELMSFYKSRGYIYNGKEKYSDDFCTVLKQKYSPIKGNCSLLDSNGNKPNIILEKQNIYIYGFDKPAFKDFGIWVKDILIDVDGAKGKNTIGIDRVPVRIYSSGRLGGMLSPVNCKPSDFKDYEMSLSSYCQAGVDINFLTTNVPFGFDIIQIGGKDGNSRKVNNNVSFIRTDCLAFGAEMLGYEDYCDKRGLHWLKSCYHEYQCAVKLNED